MRFSIPLLLVALFARAASAQSADSAHADVSAAGTYTEDQAARGKSVYESYCSACHTTSFHTDEQFRFNWFGRTVYDLFKTVKTTMPEDNPGGLSDDDYTRVVTYILKLNGFASGPDSLPADSLRMKSIRIRAATDTAASPPHP
ncbi:MAG TPA: cytochrome c [Gemmatimonadaceae bacterium]|nr:cytochrome c [Gemmatimonadaceae bacterium]